MIEEDSVIAACMLIPHMPFFHEQKLWFITILTLLTIEYLNRIIKILFDGLREF